MEQQNQNSNMPKSKNPIIGLAVVALLVVGAIIAYTSGLFKNNPSLGQNSPTGDSDNNSQSNQNNEQDGEQMMNGENMMGDNNTMGSGMMQDSKYKDGTYTINQTYRSPGGDEKFVLSMTIKSDVIVSTEFSPDPISQIGIKKQDDFNSAYKDIVVGKNIDEVSLTVVNGASLTTKGFMSALESIKAQALQS